MTIDACNEFFKVLDSLASTIFQNMTVCVQARKKLFELFEQSVDDEERKDSFARLLQKSWRAAETKEETKVELCRRRLFGMVETILLNRDESKDESVDLSSRDHVIQNDMVQEALAKLFSDSFSAIKQKMPVLFSLTEEVTKDSDYKKVVEEFQIYDKSNFLLLIACFALQKGISLFSIELFLPFQSTYRDLDSLSYSVDILRKQLQSDAGVISESLLRLIATVYSRLSMSDFTALLNVWRARLDPTDSDLKNVALIVYTQDIALAKSLANVLLSGKEKEKLLHFFTVFDKVDQTKSDDEALDCLLRSGISDFGYSAIVAQVAKKDFKRSIALSCWDERYLDAAIESRIKHVGSDSVVDFLEIHSDFILSRFCVQLFSVYAFDKGVECVQRISSKELASNTVFEALEILKEKDSRKFLELFTVAVFEASSVFIADFYDFCREIAAQDSQVAGEFAELLCKRFPLSREKDSLFFEVGRCAIKQAGSSKERKEQFLTYLHKIDSDACKTELCREVMDEALGDVLDQGDLICYNVARAYTATDIDQVLEYIQGASFELLYPFFSEKIKNGDSDVFLRYLDTIVDADEKKKCCLSLSLHLFNKIPNCIDLLTEAEKKGVENLLEEFFLKLFSQTKCLCPESLRHIQIMVEHLSEEIPEHKRLFDKVQNCQLRPDICFAIFSHPYFKKAFPDDISSDLVHYMAHNFIAFLEKHNKTFVSLLLRFKEEAFIEKMQPYPLVWKLAYYLYLQKRGQRSHAEMLKEHFLSSYEPYTASIQEHSVINSQYLFATLLCFGMPKRDASFITQD